MGTREDKDSRFFQLYIAFAYSIPLQLLSKARPGCDCVLPVHSLNHTCQIQSRSWQTVEAVILKKHLEEKSQQLLQGLAHRQDGFCQVRVESSGSYGKFIFKLYEIKDKDIGQAWVLKVTKAL